jgi:beta-glucosidase
VLGAAPVSLRAALQARGSELVLSLSDDLEAARAAMADADVAIACAGATAGESSDRDSLELDQHAFLVSMAEHAAGGATPLVVLAYSPGSLLTDPWAAGASAVLSMFFSGQETGHAAADVLYGEVNPSGRLPLTYLNSEADGTPICTTAAAGCNLTEGLSVGWRGLHGAPVAYEFGFGLSYTTFGYSWASAPAAVGAADSLRITLSVRVQNTGGRAGREVVQLYLVYPAAAAEPPLVLRGFERTGVLAAGGHQDVAFELSARQLSTWRPGEGWVREVGTFDVVVGASSRDERLRASVSVA